MRLANRVALITGGTSGIGLGIAERFLHEGAAVVVAADRAVEETVTRLKAISPEVSGVTCDVRFPAQVEQAVRHTLTSFGQLDIAVASAGVGDGATMGMSDEEKWQFTIDVNLKGVYLLASHAAQALKPHGGSIIAIASQFGLVGTRDCPAYCASKGGVVNLARAMALDYAPWQVRVNCICPAAVDTPMLQDSFRLSPDPGQAHAERVAMHPLARLGQPADIGGAALFLASDDAAWITGAILSVDGGWVAQ